jgi:hypothetical protein
MNWEPVKNVLMVVLGAAGGWTVQRGWVDNGTATQVVGAIVTILGAGFGVWKGTALNLVRTTAALSAVDAIQVNSRQIASSTPDNVTVSRA